MVFSGGDWGLRVSAAQASQAVQKQRESSAEDTEEQRVSLLFYISDIHVRSHSRCSYMHLNNASESESYRGIVCEQLVISPDHQQ